MLLIKYGDIDAVGLGPVKGLGGNGH
jgi:hypothetical protein